jgi:hypothetical protein
MNAIAVDSKSLSENIRRMPLEDDTLGHSASGAFDDGLCSNEIRGYCHERPSPLTVTSEAVRASSITTQSPPAVYIGLKRRERVQQEKREE